MSEPYNMPIEEAFCIVNDALYQIKDCPISQDEMIVIAENALSKIFNFDSKSYIKWLEKKVPKGIST